MLFLLKRLLRSKVKPKEIIISHGLGLKIERAILTPRSIVGGEIVGWIPAPAPTWDWSVFHYRVKPGPVTIPWNIHTCPLPPFTVLHRGSGFYHTVTDMESAGVMISNMSNLVYFEKLLEKYNYVPCRTTAEPCGNIK